MKNITSNDLDNLLKEKQNKNYKHYHMNLSKVLENSKEMLNFVQEVLILAERKYDDDAELAFHIGYIFFNCGLEIGLIYGERLMENQKNDLDTRTNN